MYVACQTLHSVAYSAIRMCVIETIDRVVPAKALDGRFDSRSTMLHTRWDLPKPQDKTELTQETE